MDHDREEVLLKAELGAEALDLDEVFAKALAIASAGFAGLVKPVCKAECVWTLVTKLERKVMQRFTTTIEIRLVNLKQI